MNRYEIALNRPIPKPRNVHIPKSQYIPKFSSGDKSPDKGQMVGPGIFEHVQPVRNFIEPTLEHYIPPSRHGDPLIRYSFDMITEAVWRIRHVDLNLQNLSNFKREIATIRLSFPRRFGNTTLAIELLRHFSDSVIITSNMSTKNNMIRNFELCTEGLRIYTIQSLDALFGRSFSTVIIDPTKLREDSTRKILEELIYTISADAYIFLG